MPDSTTPTYLAAFVGRCLSSGKRIAMSLATVGVIALALLWAFGAFTFGKSVTPTYRTGTVERSDLTLTAETSGSAELDYEQKLRFNQAGTVTAAHVAEGSTITRGTIIAELDQTELAHDIERAEITLKNARLQLATLKNGNDASVIQNAQNTVAETTTSLAIARATRANMQNEESATIAAAERDIAQATTNLANAKANRDTAKLAYTNAKENGDTSITTTDTTYAYTIKNAFTSIGTTITTADTILQNINDVLGVEASNASVNDAFEQYLGALNTQTKTTAELAYKAATQARETAATTYAQFKNSTSPEDAITSLRAGEALASALVDASDATYAVLQATITSSNFSQSTLDSYRSTATGNRTSARTQLNTMQSTIKTIQTLDTTSDATRTVSESIQQKENALASAELTVTKASDTLTKLQANLATTKESLRIDRVKQDDTITHLTQQLTAQKTALTEKRRGATSEDIARQENAISTAEIELATTKEKKEDYQIIAPFDGIVRSIDFKVGDKILADEEKYVYMENPDVMTITALLDQIDAVKVKAGQAADVVFDALPTKTFVGTVTKLNQMPITTSGVVSYKATIGVDTKGASVFSGMTADVTINVEKRTNVLTVATAAITTKKGKSFVSKITNGVRSDVEVTTGITDGSKTEIISGLTEGDTIVTLDLASVTASAEKKTTSLLPSGSGNRSGSSSRDAGGPPM